MKNTAPSIHAIKRTSQVSEQIAKLATMQMPELWAVWDSHFEHRPSHPNRKHLESRITYRLQEIAYGGLPTVTRDMLADHGEQHSKIKTSSRKPNGLLPGTTLLREFDGQQYRVIAMSDGRYEFDGQRYKSLSAIAKLITGTQWSGPAFFGLTGKQA